MTVQEYKSNWADRKRGHLLSTENQLSDGDQAKKTEKKEKKAFDVTEVAAERTEGGVKATFQKNAFYSTGPHGQKWSKATKKPTLYPKCSA